MLSDEQIELIRRCRKKRYTFKEIARVSGVDQQTVIDYLARNRLERQRMSFGNREPTEDDFIDGEPITARVERVKREIREYNERNKQVQLHGGRSDGERLPRHYCRMSDIASS